MTIEVKVIADSINTDGNRITTMQLKYPRFIHSEFMTHRVFSRNASSSRAIPVYKMLRAVWSEPAMPIYWGSNKPGMQAGDALPPLKRLVARFLWKSAGQFMCMIAWGMFKLGLHKQVTNRLLEPWQHIHVVVTSTEWENFFKLRCHSDAQPEFQVLARSMRAMLAASTPRKVGYGDWHLPYINCFERMHLSTKEAIQVSSSRCCRVSYMNHGGCHSTLEEDSALYLRLVNANPPHMSPVEHQATPSPFVQAANFHGWESYRYQIESHTVPHNR